MSGKTKLFAEAVTDAKTLKETALAQAKLAMAESFAPRVQSMLSSKLNEMEEEEMNEEKSLEEILNEMETEEGTEDETFETEPEETEETEDETFETEEENEEVVDLTVDELKDVIRDVMAELEGAPEEASEEMGDETFETESEETEEDDFNLDEILAEMTDSSIDPSNAATGGLENIMDMVKSAIEKSPEMASKIAEFLKGLPSGAGSAMRAEVKALEESKKQVDKLKKQLSEINLLNAKLIYVNKVFKSTNLTESRKIAVINAFDRAANVKEAENIFKTIKESVLTKPTTPLRENKGFASKATGSNQKQIITESAQDAFVLRMQKLAGLIK